MPRTTASSRRTLASGSLPANAVSVVLGTAFTFCLFLGMARYGNLTPYAAPADFVDLRAVSLPLEPPPPPRADPLPATAEPMLASVTGFDLAPSDSPVKIAVSPPSFDALTSGLQVAPPAVIQIGPLVGDFKPRTDSAEFTQHIYQQSEVDRIPMVLYRNPPNIPMRFIRGGQSLRVSLLLLIDAEGVVTSVRVAKSSGSPEVDAIVVENIKTWGFTPAIRKGRKVRCLVEQTYVFTRSVGSHFEV